MSRYDGLIIPRSYSDYINKTDAATLLQALQLSGVMDAAPTAGSNHPVKSDGLVPVDSVIYGNHKGVTSNAVAKALTTNLDDSALVNISSQVTMANGVTSVYAMRKNGIVYLSIRGTFGGVPSTSAFLLCKNLPNKYRPSVEIEGLSLLGYNSDQKVAIARLVYATSDYGIYAGENNWQNGTVIRAAIIYPAY